MPLESYSPPGFLDDFTKGQRTAWSKFIDDYMKRIVNDGDVDREQFFSLLGQDLDSDSAELPIRWSAFPKRVALSTSSNRARWRLADSSRNYQDEYCEWSVERDSGGKVRRVTFTSEGPEYWTFLARTSPETALALYRRHISHNVRKEDIFHSNGSYNAANRWNSSTSSGAMHLIQGNNTLRAEMKLASDATVQRTHNGKPVETEQELIECSRYGEASRHSDPHIGGEVNALARKGAMVSLADPVGLYIDGLSTAGWEAPDGADPQDFWNVTRGTKTHAVRAVYEVGPGHDYLVGDIRINGLPIRFGGQIADHITIRLNGVAHRFGKYTKAPHECVGLIAQAAPEALSVEKSLEAVSFDRR